MSRTFAVALLSCILGACVFFGGKSEPVAPQASASASEPRRDERHVAQIDFGQRARFAECVYDACPSRTPKTIATAATRPPILPSPAPQAAPDSLEPRAKPAIATTPRSAASDAAEQTLTLRFALGKATLTNEHKAQLRTALPDLRRSARIRIAGRTDDLGSEALNQSLALARGLAVRDYLLGLDPQLPARISIDARGRCCYLADNDNEQARSRNRRVELSYAGAMTSTLTGASSGASRVEP